MKFKLRISAALFCTLMVYSVIGFGQALHWLTPSQSDPGPALNGSIEGAKISANGRYISFTSAASNHIIGDHNQRTDLFMYDRLSDQIVRANELGSTQTSGSVFFISHTNVTSDGQFIAFKGAVLADDTNDAVSGIFLKNLNTGLLKRVNLDQSGNDIAVGFSFNDIYLDDSGTSLVFTTDQPLDPRHMSGENIYRLNLNDQTTTLLTVSADNTSASSRGAVRYSLSANGRFLVFSSRDTNLVENSAGFSNVYLRDTQNLTTQLVTVQPNGEPSEFIASSHNRMAVSNAGTVVFLAANNDLTANDSGSTTDLFIYDGIQNSLIAPGFIDRLLISGDGGVVLFGTGFALEASDTNGVTDAYTYDTSTGEFTRITDNTSTTNFVNIYTESISVNGQDILLTSNVREFNGITSASSEIYQGLFHYDLSSSQTTPIAPTAFNPNTLIGGVESTFISSDQRYVVINTHAPNVLSQLQNEANFDVFFLDREADQRSLIARKARAEDISTSGRYVVFRSQFLQPAGEIDLGVDTLMIYDHIDNDYTQIGEGFFGKVNDEGVVVFSSSSDLLPADNNGFTDVYLFDPSDASVSLISINLTGLSANGESTWSGISNLINGDTWVTFQSDADDLVNVDLNEHQDVFMVNWPGGNVIRVSQTPAGTGGNAFSILPAVSADGSAVVFASFADNLVNQVTAFESHIYVYQRNTQLLELITQDQNQMPLDTNASEAEISDSGRYVIFHSDREFYQGDDDSSFDVFLVDRETQDMQLLSQPLSGTGVLGDYFGSQVSENNTVSPTLVGINIVGAGGLTGLAEHPGSRESYLFQQGGPNVDLEIDIIGMGSVQGTFGISCMTTCNSDYPLGTVLNLAAVPEPGFVFDRWSSSRGQCIDDTNPCVLTMNRTKSIQAIFIEPSEIIFSNEFE